MTLKETQLTSINFDLRRNFFLERKLNSFGDRGFILSIVQNLNVVSSTVFPSLRNISSSTDNPNIRAGQYPHTLKPFYINDIQMQVEGCSIFAVAWFPQLVPIRIAICAILNSESLDKVQFPLEKEGYIFRCYSASLECFRGYPQFLGMVVNRFSRLSFNFNKLPLLKLAVFTKYSLILFRLQLKSNFSISSKENQRLPLLATFTKSLLFHNSIIAYLSKPFSYSLFFNRLLNKLQKSLFSSLIIYSSSYSLGLIFWFFFIGEVNNA